MKQASSQLVIANLDMIKAHADGKAILQRQKGSDHQWKEAINGPEFLNSGFEFKVAPTKIYMRKYVHTPNSLWVECTYGEYKSNPSAYEYTIAYIE